MIPGTRPIRGKPPKRTGKPPSPGISGATCAVPPATAPGRAPGSDALISCCPSDRGPYRIRCLGNSNLPFGCPGRRKTGTAGSGLAADCVSYIEAVCETGRPARSGASTSIRCASRPRWSLLRCWLSWLLQSRVVVLSEAVHTSATRRARGASRSAGQYSWRFAHCAPITQRAGIRSALPLPRSFSGHRNAC